MVKDIESGIFFKEVSMLRMKDGDTAQFKEIEL